MKKNYEYIQYRGKVVLTAVAVMTIEEVRSGTVANCLLANSMQLTE